MFLYDTYDNHSYIYSKTVSLCEDIYVITLILLPRYITTVITCVKDTGLQPVLSTIYIHYLNILYIST